MLKPSLIFLYTPPLMNVVISGLQAQVWDPLDMAVSSAWGDHRGPVWAGIPSSTYDCMRAEAGCLTRFNRLTIAFCCLEARND